MKATPRCLKAVSSCQSTDQNSIEMKKASQQRGLFHAHHAWSWAIKKALRLEGLGSAFKIQRSVRRLKFGGWLQVPNLFVPVREKPMEVNIHPMAAPRQDGQDFRHDAISLTSERRYIEKTLNQHFLVYKVHAWIHLDIS